MFSYTILRFNYTTIDFIQVILHGDDPYPFISSFAWLFSSISDYFYFIFDSPRSPSILRGPTHPQSIYSIETDLFRLVSMLHHLFQVYSPHFEVFLLYFIFLLFYGCAAFVQVMRKFSHHCVGFSLAYSAIVASTHVYKVATVFLKLRLSLSPLSSASASVQLCLRELR